VATLAELPPPARLPVRLPPRPPPRARDHAFLVMLAAASLLAAIDGFAGLTYPGRSRIAHAPLAWFHASAEWTVPTLFSVATMAWVGVACLLRASPPRRWWRVVGVLFCYLAFDDLLMLHERVGALLHPLLGGVGVYAWVIALAPVFAVAGVLGAFHLQRALAADTRRRVLLLLGFAALGIAVGFEACEDGVVESTIRWRGIELLAYTQWAEESLELLGPVLLLGAVREPSQRAAG
jgi:hypothetical protein